MSAPIALQLYSLRELLNVDYAAGIRKVAAIGYAGVEIVRLSRHDPAGRCAALPGGRPDRLLGAQPVAIGR